MSHCEYVCRHCHVTIVEEHDPDVITVGSTLTLLHEHLVKCQAEFKDQKPLSPLPLLRKFECFTYG